MSLTFLLSVFGIANQILPTVTPAVSFVIAAKDGTDKTLQARRTPGCAVVKLSWLMECFWSLSRRDPMPHLLGPTGSDMSTQHAKEGSNSTEPNAGQNRILFDHEDESEEDEDDDFAAEFEKELM